MDADSCAAHWFGKVQNGEMVLSDTDKIVYDEWPKTPKIRPNVKLDEFAVMPNYFHGILIIKNNCKNRKSHFYLPQRINRYFPP